MNWLKLLIVFILFISVSRMLSAQETDFMMDERDGNVYLVTQFGNLWWMCQNLKYDAGEGSFCYDDDENNCMLEGRFYNFETARNACPEGYRLPSDEDWMALESYIGMNQSELSQKYMRMSGNVGKYLKSGGGFGFNAEMVGIINPGNKSAKAGQQVIFWTSTKMNDGNVWVRSISHDADGINRTMVPIGYGLSVRCVKDAEPNEK
jgi:uncharacterized protein (TIGR02145 family)